MAKQSVKVRNKQKKRRLIGLKTKSHEYGKLDDIELVLCIFNKAKDQFYSYVSTEEVFSWLDMEKILTHPNSVHERAADLESVTPGRKHRSSGQYRTKLKACQSGDNSTQNEQDLDANLLARPGSQKPLVIPEAPSFDITMLKKNRRSEA